MEGLPHPGGAGLPSHRDTGRLAEILAENGISIFAISTYNTDYVLMKKESYQKALDILGRTGYEIVE